MKSAAGGLYADLVAGRLTVWQADCVAGNWGLGDAAHPELWRPTRHGGG